MADRSVCVRDRESQCVCVRDDYNTCEEWERHEALHNDVQANRVHGRQVSVFERERVSVCVRDDNDTHNLILKRLPKHFLKI